MENTELKTTDLLTNISSSITYHTPRIAKALVVTGVAYSALYGYEALACAPGGECRTSKAFIALFIVSMLSTFLTIFVAAQPYASRFEPNPHGKQTTQVRLAWRFVFFTIYAVAGFLLTRGFLNVSIDESLFETNSLAIRKIITMSTLLIPATSFLSMFYAAADLTALITYRNKPKRT
jgi:hypothetical protein